MSKQKIDLNGKANAIGSRARSHAYSEHTNIPSRPWCRSWKLLFMKPATMIMMTSGARTEMSYGRGKVLSPVSSGFLFFSSIICHTPTARWSSLALWQSTDIEWTNRPDRTLGGMEEHNLPCTDVFMKKGKLMPSVEVGRTYDKSKKKS